MLSPRLQPSDRQALHQQLHAGDQLDAAEARQLLDEVDALRAELASSRVTFARKAADALAKRLHSVAAFNHGGCPSCRDAEAKRRSAEERDSRSRDLAETALE
ncbi:MAG TPA: hypothetical protein VFG53_08295 [Anaeromyxobacter sp.]|nr:hypothetical protein [Anaeromyxobacter sp.]